jgi:predicted ATP-dependent Lon-type protease
VANVRYNLIFPDELLAKFQTGSYADPTDAVYKVLGVK